MSKKKKNQPVKIKDRTKIDERLKQISQIQPPDSNPFKMENDQRIDSFLRFGLKKKVFEGTIREKLRMKKDKHNRFD